MGEIKTLKNFLENKGIKGRLFCDAVSREVYKVQTVIKVGDEVAMEVVYFEGSLSKAVLMLQRHLTDEFQKGRLPRYDQNGRLYQRPRLAFQQSI